MLPITVVKTRYEVSHHFSINSADLLTYRLWRSNHALKLFLSSHVRWPLFSSSYDSAVNFLL